MKIILTILATLLVAVLAVFIGIRSGRYNVGADVPHSGPVYATLVAGREHSHGGGESPGAGQSSAEYEHAAPQPQPKTHQHADGTQHVHR